MVEGWRETTELSSLMASSTTSRFGDFFLSSIAVLKSFFDFLKQTIMRIKTRDQFNFVVIRGEEGLTSRKIQVGLT